IRIKVVRFLPLGFFTWRAGLCPAHAERHFGLLIELAGRIEVLLMLELRDGFLRPGAHDSIDGTWIDALLLKRSLRALDLFGMNAALFRAFLGLLCFGGFSGVGLHVFFIGRRLLVCL